MNNIYTSYIIHIIIIDKMNHKMYHKMYNKMYHKMYHKMNAII